jgi:hypothetical protein
MFLRYAGHIDIGIPGGVERADKTYVCIIPVLKCLVVLLLARVLGGLDELIQALVDHFKVSVELHLTGDNVPGEGGDSG